MSPVFVLSVLLALTVLGGIVFYILVTIAALRFRNSRENEQQSTREGTGPQPPGGGSVPSLPAGYRDPGTIPKISISVLKPLSGPEPELESNLRSFFQLSYTQFELLFAAREESDPAVAIVRRLQDEFPQVPSQIILTGEPEFPNAKVYSLMAMSKRARYDLFVISDSDIRAGAAHLEGIAVDFDDPQTGVSTCPYRAVPGKSFWSLLEAIGMNTEFWGGVLVARMLEGMRFAVGPTMAIRRACLEKIRGFERVREYLAEDFVIGQLAYDSGFKVVLSHHVVEHRIGAQSFGENFRHRLRWNRSTRRSRPAGYVGQLFTNPLPLALLLVALPPHASWTWWLLAVCALFRAAALLAVGPGVLHDHLTLRYFWLVPLQDIASFIVWCLAFFGKTIVWRGRSYELQRDGTLRLL